MANDQKHPSHVTRWSDASSLDEVCALCDATNIAGGGWGDLAKPCPTANTAVAAAAPAEAPTEFRREQRYIVIKQSDMQRYLSAADREQIDRLCGVIRAGREADGRGNQLSAVVEHDWPEYEIVWAMLRARLAGHTNPLERLRRQAEDLKVSQAVLHAFLRDLDAWLSFRELGAAIEKEDMAALRGTIAQLLAGAHTSALAPIEVTDAMALAFHRALTDGSIGQGEVDELKTGLRAALRAAPPARVLPEDLFARLLSLFEAKSDQEARHKIDLLMKDLSATTEENTAR